MTTTAMPIHVLDADSTRAEVEEALGHVCREAVRAPHIIHRYGQPPTKHERLHRVPRLAARHARGRGELNLTIRVLGLELLSIEASTDPTSPGPEESDEPGEPWHEERCELRR